VDSLFAEPTPIIDPEVVYHVRLDNEVADESEHLRRDGERLIEQIMTHRMKFAVPFARVVESLERTALYSVDIAEISINLAEKT